jgi:hypothetical protein
MHQAAITSASRTIEAKPRLALSTNPAENKGRQRKPELTGSS